jgi:protease I
MSRIAFVLADDFEDSEFRIPYDALRKAGHTVDVIGIEAGTVVRGKKGREQVKLDGAAHEKTASEYDALVIPGGYSPDHLRIHTSVVDFVRGFIGVGKLVAAVCHGPQLLIEADAVRDKTMTSFPAIRKDLENAGARWVDQQVAIDGNLITSRRPDDLHAFSDAILDRLAMLGARRKAG